MKLRDLLQKIQTDSTDPIQEDSKTAVPEDDIPIIYVDSIFEREARPLGQKKDGSCYWCSGTSFWRSKWKVICVRCHPPVNPDDVIELINNNKEGSC